MKKLMHGKEERTRIARKGWINAKELRRTLRRQFDENRLKIKIAVTGSVCMWQLFICRYTDSKYC